MGRQEFAYSLISGVELDDLESGREWHSAVDEEEEGDGNRTADGNENEERDFTFFYEPRWGYFVSAIVPLALFVFFLALNFALDSGSSAPPLLSFLLSFSDAVIAVSYFFIPGAMFTFVIKRKDINTNMWVVWMFGAFIVCCGLTHLVAAVGLWFQVQWIQVGMKIITAAISYATAIAVYKLIPLAMVIPSPIQLEKEVKERKHAQLQLQKQYQRTVALARVTKEIRKSLKFQDICNATASQCIDVFRADLCSVYRCDCQRSKDSPKMGKSSVQNMKEFRGKEKDFEEDGDQESHTCYLISEYDRLSPEEAITDRQGAKSVVTPPLLSIVGLVDCAEATVIDFELMQQRTFNSLPSPIELDGNLVEFYRSRQIRSILCMGVPYRQNSHAIIVLQLRHNSTLRPEKWWNNEDIGLLQEVIAQVAIGLEHAHLLGEAIKGRKLACQNLALERDKERAEQNSQAKSEFLAVVSHEIRTPMNAICGMTKVLKSFHISREQKECVQIISSSAKALLSLLNNILDFSKIEAGKTEINACPFDLRKCINNLMGLMANYTTGRHQAITLSTIIDPAVPSFVIGDKQHLRQVLINLLSNAIKFTPKGSITLRVQTNSPFCEETSNSDPECAQIEFEVADTGIGIPQEKQSRLFHPFSQVDSSATRKYEGTGLGLVISKRLCELMGGQMDFKSEEGKGSVFRFTVRLKLGTSPESDEIETGERARLELELQNKQQWRQLRTAMGDLRFDHSTAEMPIPKASSYSSLTFSDDAEESERSDDDASPQTVQQHMRNGAECRSSLPMIPASDNLKASHSSNPGDPNHKNHSILLVEDNIINQKVACKLLNQIGHTEIMVVNNGHKAVEAVRTAQKEGRPFSAILMDLHMPEMDGITASRIIKKNSEGQPPYIIACTADLQDGTRKECTEAGITGYLEKPIKLKELSRVLSDAFRGTV